jgi:branched-chain amino acid transport system substrate-binding protein
MNTIRTYRWPLIGVVLLVLALLFTSLSTPPHDEIVIGVLVPLTGKSASLGERVKAGIEIGVEELRSEGIAVRVIFEDDKGEAPTAVTAARKLMETDGVRMIIGTVKSDAMLAVAPITEESEVILLSPTAGADSISQAGDFVFRVIETPNIHGEAAAAYIGAEKRTALFVANAANAQSYGAAFRASFKGDLVFDAPYSQNAIDFRTEIAKAKSAGAEAFYLAIATAKDAGLLVKQIRESGFTGPVMVSVAAEAKEFFDAAGPYAEGTAITASFFSASSSPGGSFNTRFRELTGSDGDGFAANGYDAVMLLGRATKKCGTDSSCIRDVLYATKEYEGAGGTLTFDRNGDVAKPVQLKIAQEGRFVLAQP